MTGILNITNGECAVQVMRQGDITRVFLSWDDVLHDLPVHSQTSVTHGASR